MDKRVQLLLNKLNEQQIVACLLLDNYILTACPGSGKTRTIIYRLAYFSIIYEYSRLKNIAITYTSRAADEISERLDNLGIETNEIWTGTIHQFCLEYVIRPYYIYVTRLKNGYRIIDEYIQEEYVKQICQNKNEQYENNFRDLLKDERFYIEYFNLLVKKREIDFNDILDISLELLRTHSFIKNNISRQIRSIQVDEYQDTTIKQYEIIKLIFQANQSIIISFVGDINQAIYKSIGGVALNIELLNEMFGINFVKLKLSNCYRSTKKIIDYYVNYQVNAEEINSLSSMKIENSRIMYDFTTSKDDLVGEVAKIISYQLRNGVSENEICVLTPQWWMIYDFGKKLRELLPYISFDSPELTPVKYDPLNPFYLVTRLIFTEAGRNTKRRKRIAKDLISFLSRDYKINIPDKINTDDILRVINSTENQDNGISMIINCVNRLFKILNISEMDTIVHNEFNAFFNHTQERIRKYKLSDSSDNFKKCFKERKGIVLSTYHGAKGEEYDTVIATGLLFGFIPNWHQVFDNSIDENVDAKLLVYVACSRARTNLFLFSETGRFTKKNNEYERLRLIVKPNNEQ